MDVDKQKIDELTLQINNLANENKILKIKMKENKDQGKIFNDLFHLLDKNEGNQSFGKNEDSDKKELKYFLNRNQIKELNEKNKKLSDTNRELLTQNITLQSELTSTKENFTEFKKEVFLL